MSSVAPSACHSFSLPARSVTSARWPPGRKVIAQGSAKRATSCTVKGASASGVAGWSPDVSSAAVSAPSPDCAWLGWQPPEQAATRSEEHTSELQSLMRISYAVFCLKKKKKRQNTNTQEHRTKKQ